MEGVGVDSTLLVGSDQPTRWLRVRAWLLLKLLPVVIAISGLPLAILALVAAVQGLWIRVYNLHANSYVAVRDWVAGLDPVPDPPSRNEEIANKIVSLVRDFDYYLLVLLVTGIITLVSVWLVLCWLLRTPVKRFVYKMQGIEYEAMRPGSDFIESKVPNCQVSILRPGHLRHSHVGYGIRVTHSLMAVPTHVVQGFDEIIVRGPLNSLAFRPNVIASRVHSDLSYIHIEASKWVKIGVPIAKLMTSLPGTFGRCYGPRGYSMGRLSKSKQINFMMVYEGSTEPGMSGSPYMIGDAVVGMHCGVLGDANSGVSAALMKSELLQLVSSEAVHGGISSSAAADSANYFGNKVEAQVRAWDEKELDRAVKAAYSVDWNVLNDMAVDYNKQLDFESRKAKTEPFRVSQTTFSVPSEQSTPLIRQLQQAEQVNQNDESKHSVIQVVAGPAGSKCLTLEEEFMMLKRRVEELETTLASFSDKIKGLEAQVSDLKVFSDDVAERQTFVRCSYCNAELKNDKTRLQRHYRKCHAMDPKKEKVALVGESAIPSDSKKVVKMAPFLGKSPSTRKSQSSSKNTSRSLERVNPSRSLVEVLSKMVESQNRIELLLSNSQQTMTGPSSAVTQN